MQVVGTCQFDLNRLTVRRNRAVYNNIRGWRRAWRRASYAQDHDFCGFDKSRGNLSLFQMQLTHGIRGYHRRDLLPPNRQCDLRHDSFNFNIDYPANELVAGADSPELSATLGKWSPFLREPQVPVQFAFRNPVMSTLGSDGPQFSRVYPSFEGGITDAQYVGGIA